MDVNKKLNPAAPSEPRRTPAQRAGVPESAARDGTPSKAQIAITAIVAHVSNQNARINFPPIRITCVMTLAKASCSGVIGDQFLQPNDKVEQLAANRLTMPQDAIASLLQRLVRHPVGFLPRTPRKHRAECDRFGAIISASSLTASATD